MKIEDRPLYIVISLMIVAFFILSAQIASITLPIVYRMIFILVFFFIWVFAGLSFVRRYEIDREGITVIWYGVFKHKYPWSSFSQLYVCLAVNSNREFPCIICAGKKWPAKTKHTHLMAFYPFSTFMFEYTPERVAKLIEYGLKVNYRASHADITRSYEKNLLNYRW